MQDGKTALERAVDRGHHTVVGYLASQMDVTQFDMVCNKIFVFVCMCTVISKVNNMGSNSGCNDYVVYANALEWKHVMC